MRRTGKSGLVVGLVLAMGVVLTGCGAPPIVAKQEESLAAAWDGYRGLDVHVPNGGIEVRAGSVDEVQIRAEKQAHGHTLTEAEAHVGQIEVLTGPATDDPGILRVWVEYPWSLRRMSPSATLIIEVPEPCGLQARTSNGRIIVDDMEGEIELETSNGRVVVEDLLGEVDIDTSNGRVIARDVAGRLDIHTGNGRVRVERLVGSLRADTSNGRVYAEVEPGQTDGIEIRSSNGSIAVLLPEQLGADLDLSTGNGSVRVDFPPKAWGQAARGKSDMGSVPFEDVRAALHGGGVPVEVRSSNGSITVRPK